MNVSFEYLYRDAGNNKIWGDVDFSNKMNTDVFVLISDIKNTLIDSEFFIPDDVDLPTLYFEQYDDKLDHGWHEYFSVKDTANRPNDGLCRDICEFISVLKLSKLRSGLF